MLPRPIRHRRGRREDFVAIMEVLAASGVATPPPDRATLRRFRGIIADLGTDLYVALSGARVVGFVHVTYARQITVGTRARMEALVVAPDARRQGIGSSLAKLACQRAERRGCRDLRSSTLGSTSTARQFLARNGWLPAGEEFRVDLAGPAK